MYCSGPLLLNFEDMEQSFGSKNCQNGESGKTLKPFTRQVDTAVKDKMFGQKYGPRKMTLEKPLIESFHLPRGIVGEKAPNQELPPKSGDITCMLTQ